jgi:hypothetical protein
MASDVNTDKRDAQIRAMAKDGKTYAAIGEKFKLSTSRVSLIVRFNTPAKYKAMLEARPRTASAKRANGKAKAHGKGRKVIARIPTKRAKRAITKQQSARRPAMTKQQAQAEAKKALGGKSLSEIAADVSK